MQTRIRITAEVDATIRQRVAELYAQAPGIAFPEGSVAGWIPEPGSYAARAHGIVLPAFTGTAESDGGVDLALSIAHGFLREASDQIATTAFLTVAPPHIRWGTIGPIARAAAERAATVRWLFSASSEPQLLARALLIEIRGAENHRKWLGQDDQIGKWIQELAVIAANELGRGVETDRSGKCIGVAGERMPSLTELIRSASATEGSDDRSYAELSIFTHPTGLSARAFNTSGHYVQQRQLMFEPDATMHAEARLMEDCVLAFAQATTLAHSYLGRDTKSALNDWLEPLTSAWREWCCANGCRDGVEHESTAHAQS